MSGLLKSCPCTRTQLEAPAFQEWVTKLHDPPGLLARKLWEWAYICQALAERGMLAPNRRGLGFAVGREPLVALFAAHGCDLLATDLAEDGRASSRWSGAHQHAAGLEALNERGICPPEEFAKRVQFRTVDMNRIPGDLRDFDFVWSSCAFEHLGSIRRGKRFIRRMTRCLRPGGVAVHTTEFNVLSNRRTLDHHQDVLFRRRDVEEMARWLNGRGHCVELDFTLGETSEDWQIDRPPYGRMPHLKLQIGEYVSTSYGLIVEIGRPQSWWRRLRGVG